MSAIRWEQDGLPPSVNAGYVHFRNRSKAPKRTVTTWQARLRDALIGLGQRPPPKTPWTLHLTLIAPDIHKWDGDNRLKFTQDSIKAALGVDDCYCDDTRVTKQRGRPARMVITVTWE